MRVFLVGEMNPYGADPHYALYPAPDGCSGHRLCCLILGMRRKDYVDSFERVNLCDGKWSMPMAMARAESIWDNPDPAARGRYILLGTKVSAAWKVPFVPFEVSEGGTVLVLPHPSGLNRMWNQPGTIELARKVVKSFVPPELAAKIGTSLVAN